MRHRHFVCDEEVVEVPGDKSCRGRLSADDANNVLSIEFTLLAKEGTSDRHRGRGRGTRDAKVSCRRARIESFCAIIAMYSAVLYRPAGEGTGALLDIVFGVVANSHREEVRESPDRSSR